MRPKKKEAGRSGLRDACAHRAAAVVGSIDEGGAEIGLFYEEFQNQSSTLPNLANSETGLLERSENNRA